MVEIFNILGMNVFSENYEFEKRRELIMSVATQQQRTFSKTQKADMAHN